MLGDPLKPGVVHPMDRDQEPAVSEPEDTRPLWLRLLRGIRPTASVERDKKDGKLIGTIGIKTGAEF